MVERTHGLFNGAFLILLVVLSTVCILFSIIISDDSPADAVPRKPIWNWLWPWPWLYSVAATRRKDIRAAGIFAFLRGSTTFTAPEDRASRVFEQETYKLAFCYWLMCIYLPCFLSFPPALIYMVIPEYTILRDHACMLFHYGKWLQYFPRVLVLLAMVLVEALSAIAVFTLCRAASSLRYKLADDMAKSAEAMPVNAEFSIGNASPADSSLDFPDERDLPENGDSVDDEKVTANLAVDSVVPLSAASTALAVAFCLHIPLWSLSLSAAVAILLAVVWRSLYFELVKHLPARLVIPIKLTAPLTVAVTLFVGAGIFGWWTITDYHTWMSSGIRNWMVGRLLFSLQSMDLASGVSPLIPLILGGIAAISIILCPIHRIYLLGPQEPEASYLNFDHVPSFEGVEDQTKRIDCLLRKRGWDLPYASAFLVLGFIVFLCLTYLYAERSIEGTCFGVLLLLSALVVYIGISRAVLRFVLTWRAIRVLLHRLYWHPSRQAYAQFRKLLPKGQAIPLSSNIPNFTALEISLERARQIVRISKDAKTSAPLMTTADWVKLAIDKAEKNFWKSLPRQTGNHSLPDAGARLTAEKLVSEITRMLSQLLERKWRFLADPASAKSVDKEIAEEGGIFVVARVVDYLRRILPQLVSHAIFITVAMVFMVVTLTSYPFAAENTLQWLSWIIVIAAVSAMAYVFISMNRDRILSLLDGTTPGKFTWTSDFTVHLIIYGLIPILGLLSVSFPEALRTPISWIGSLFSGRPS